MRKLLKACVASLAWPALIQPSLASDANECKPWKPEYIKNNHLLIGKINILSNDIFDTSSQQESTSLHKLANNLHSKTKTKTIKQQLLFKTGDSFSPLKLAETERYLRTQKYIKDARVSPKQLCGQHVTVKVSTRDNWTLTPGINFGRSGGNNKVGFQLQEQNIFGYGKGIILLYTKESERHKTKLSYNDSHLLGSHHKLVLDLLNNSDGKGYKVDLSLPFYKTDSKKSWGMTSSKLKQAIPIYSKGEVVEKITENKQFDSLYYGWSTSHNKKSTNRFKVGWSVKKSQYLKTLDSDHPIELTESYPWLEFTSFKTRYIKKKNFNTMGKIEDIPLTRYFSLGAGFLLKEFGSSDKHLKLTAGYSKGIQLNPSLLSSVTLKTDNYLGEGSRKGGSHSIKAVLNHFNYSGNDIRLSSTFKFTNNLKPSEHIYLGGDSGLRGYPKAYQAGNKSLIFQAEKRLHFDWYPLQLAKFGAMAFSDFGSSWGDDSDPKILADIGVGLRMIPTRASSAKTLRLNLAMPLVGRDNIDKFQLSITTANSF